MIESKPGTRVRSGRNDRLLLMKTGQRRMCMGYVNKGTIERVLNAEGGSVSHVGLFLDKIGRRVLNDKDGNVLGNIHHNTYDKLDRDNPAKFVREVTRWGEHVYKKKKGLGEIDEMPLVP